MRISLSSPEGEVCCPCVTERRAVVSRALRGRRKDWRTRLLDPVLFALALSVPLLGPATTLTVPGEYATIQGAVTAAQDGDEVVVSPGIYVENIQFSGRNIVLRSTDPENEAVVASTVIDGNQAGPVIAFFGNELTTCVITGLTITNGRAVNGGGLSGRSVSSYHSSPTIRKNRITTNTATEDGGGLYTCWGTIEDNLIAGNVAEGSGGGLSYCYGLIQRNTISGNRAMHTEGGGLQSCYGVIRDNDIIGNVSDSYGGGISVSIAYVINNKIVGNTARYGGGLYRCTGVVQSNLIAGNQVSSGYSYGGGLANCNAALVNNTVSSNSAGTQGGGLWSCGGLIINCIIWGNYAPVGPQLYSSNGTINSCVEGGATGKDNISSDPQFVAPSAGDFRLQGSSPCIDAGNMCYLAGSTYLGIPPYIADLAGNCRVSGANVDIGCYESSSSPDEDGDLLADSAESTSSTNPLVPDTDGDGLMDGVEGLRGTSPLVFDAPAGLSVPADCTTVQEAIFLALTSETVTLFPGVHVGNIHTLNKNVHIEGTDAEDWQVVESTVLDGGAFAPVVMFGGSEFVPSGGPGNYTGTSVRGVKITNGVSITGGGIYGSSGPGIVERNWITSNSAVEGGGIAECSGRVSRNRVTSNTATKEGGGLYACQGVIVSNVIAWNRAASGGGVYGSSILFNFNTLVANTASVQGGGLYSGSWLGSCIIWRNQAPSVPQLWASVVDYCCIEGWSGGGRGNITADPLFTNESAGDFRLTALSPCIDAGTSISRWTVIPTNDIEGMLRPVYVTDEPRGDGAHYDIGAYEYVPGSAGADSWFLFR